MFNASRTASVGRVPGRRTTARVATGPTVQPFPSGCRTPLSGLDRGPVPGGRGRASLGAWRTPGGDSGGGRRGRARSPDEVPEDEASEAFSGGCLLGPTALLHPQLAWPEQQLSSVCLPLGQSEGAARQRGGCRSSAGKWRNPRTDRFSGLGLAQSASLPRPSHSVHRSPEVASLPPSPAPEDNCCSGQASCGWSSAVGPRRHPPEKASLASSSSTSSGERARPRRPRKSPGGGVVSTVTRL